MLRLVYLALAALPAIGVLATAPLAPAKTTAVAFDAASMKITQRAQGSCWTDSIASRRHDAYRCSVDNEIHDPCFTIDRKSVACPIDLAANSGLRIALTKPLPPPNSGNARNPFVMQLAGGIRCNIGTGTVVPDYPFYCTGDLVCASPSSSSPAHAIFVTCGRSKDGLHVSDTGRYLVKVMYE